MIMAAVAMMLCLPAMGQKTKQNSRQAESRNTESRQAEIRRAYSDAMELIKRQKEPGVDGRMEANYMTVTKRINVAGSGPMEETLEMYGVPKDNDHYITYNALVFVRQNIKYFDSLAKPITREYLFDPETEELIFCFIKRHDSWAEEPVTVENREYYYKDGSLCKSLVKIVSEETKREKSIPEIHPSDGEDDKHEAARLLNIFREMVCE